MNDDFLSAMGRPRKALDYTLEEIEQAEKRMKKKGGTLQENLDIVTGRKAAPLNPSRSGMSDLIGSSVAGIRDLAGQIAKREQPA